MNTMNLLAKFVTDKHIIIIEQNYVQQQTAANNSTKCGLECVYQQTAANNSTKCDLECVYQQTAANNSTKCDLECVYQQTAGNNSAECQCIDPKNHFYALCHSK